MTYTTKQYESYLEKLKEISQYEWVQNHLELKGMPNFWTILEYGEEKDYGKRSAHEIRSSRMIRWLVDANETHNLGNVFAYKLMQAIGVDYPYEQGENKAIKATSEDMDIDIFYKDYSKEICLAIELKQYAKEGKTNDATSQLDKYETLVEQLIDNSDHPMKPHYIYLTPQKDAPSNNNWHPVGYQELIDIIEDVVNHYLTDSTVPYAADTKKIITDFKHDLQRSMDYSAKKNNEINTMLTDDEKKLTTALAEEIEHEVNTNYLEQILDVNQDDIPHLEAIILITKEYIYAQDHSPNNNIQVLIRKIYNYISGDKQLDTVNIDEYTGNARISTIKHQLIEEHGLTVDQIQITGGKGQGLFLIDESETFRIYLSGDAKGDFPNDYIHLLPMPNDKKARSNSTYVPNRLFNLNESSLEDDIIRYKKENKTISFEQLMTEHVIPAIKELNDRGTSSFE